MTAPSLPPPTWRVRSRCRTHTWTSGGWVAGPTDFVPSHHRPHKSPGCHVMSGPALQVRFTQGCSDGGGDAFLSALSLLIARSIFGVKLRKLVQGIMGAVMSRHTLGPTSSTALTAAGGWLPSKYAAALALAGVCEWMGGRTCGPADCHCNRGAWCCRCVSCWLLSASIMCR
jgi:hypothetical protein